MKQTVINIITIVLILAFYGAAIYLLLEYQFPKELKPFLLVSLISTGAALTSTFIIGKISGDGILGFLNIKSVSGGFAVWLISFAIYIFYFKSDEIGHCDLVNGLSDMAGFKIIASAYIWDEDKHLKIDNYHLYNDDKFESRFKRIFPDERLLYFKELNPSETCNILKSVEVSNNILKISFDLSRLSGKSPDVFGFYFNQNYASKVALQPRPNWHRFSNGTNKLYLKSQKDFNYNIKLHLK